MRVKPYAINKGQKSQFFVLVTDDQGKGDNFVLNSAPNNWKTQAGAIRWAEKNGYKVRKPAEKAVSKTPSKPKTANPKTKKAVKKKAKFTFGMGVKL